VAFAISFESSRSMLATMLPASLSYQAFAIAVGEKASPRGFRVRWNLRR
jgi:hypothetical protein